MVEPIHRQLLDQATMKSACKSFAGGTLPKNIQDRLPKAFSVPGDLQSVAHTFKEIQEERHLADYDMGRAFVRADVLSHLRDVEQAIALFEGISGGVEAQFFLVCLLTWDSLTGRK